MSVTVIVSPKISHNTPEFIVSSYRKQGQQPWTEWRKVFSQAQSKVTNGVLGKIFSGATIGGYGTYTEEYTKTDGRMPFKEVDINGHPLSLLPTLLANGDMQVPTMLQDSVDMELSDGDSDGDLDDDSDSSLGDDDENEDEEKERDYMEAAEEALEWVETSGFPAIFLSPEILDVFSYVNTIKDIGSTVKSVSEVVDMFKQIGDVVGGGVGSVSVEFNTDQMMCPSGVLPFTPYFLSGLDLLSWRLPLFDVISHYADIGYAMVPFAPDRKVIGTHHSAPVPGRETWGSLYPRIGFVGHDHDGKVGAVVTHRAIDLLLNKEGDDNLGHIMLFDPGFPNYKDHRIIPYAFNASGITGGTFQKVYPKPSYQCQSTLYNDRNVSQLANDTSAPRSTYQSYVHTFWRRYECCMNRGGAYVTDVDIDPICISGEVIADPESDEDDESSESDDS